MEEQELKKEEKKKTRYVCEGECGAELTQEEWEQDATKTCKDEHCSHVGIPFARKEN